MPKIVVDGAPHQVDDGKNLLEACLELGYDLPFFCWHPALGSVGACRQCAVRVGNKIVMACMTAADDGVELSIADPEATDFRRSVIEWLMLNHPHDCPVCDEGGECHLQDMTVMTGHVYRRNQFAKRSWRNQDLGPFLHHEMNRCIQCYRCVRFYERTGHADLTVLGVRDRVYFGRQTDGVLESPFSGNLDEVCPTGVFTDKTLRRHYVRKWDLTQAPSICGHCATGCNTIPGERYGTLRRIQNRFNRDVNGWFLCDRGRFGYEFVNGADRIRAPRDRQGPLTVDDARARLGVLGGELIGIGSPRASLESNLALRERVGADRFYAGVPRAELALLRAAAELYRGVPAASVRDVEEADAVLVLGEDVLGTAPRMALAILRAATNEPRARAMARLKVPAWHDQALRDAIGDEVGPVFVATPAPTLLDPSARAYLRATPDDIVRLALEVARGEGPIAEAMAGARSPVVVAGISLGSEALLRAAAAAARRLGGKLALALPECDSLGLALLTDRSLDDALEAAADAAIVLENDLYRRLPASRLDPWLEGLRELAVLDHVEHRTSTRATLVLPAGTYAESSGTYVSSEGRAQRFFRVMPPDGVVLDAWRWLQPGWERLDDALAAISRVPSVARAAEAAPGDEWRAPDRERVPRQPPRYSGRTAMYAGRTLHEPQPPADPDSPLSFSMEGAATPAPGALRTFQWLPQWNSDTAAVVVGGADAAPGVRLLEPDGRDLPLPDAPNREEPDGHVLVLESHLVLGTEELSARAQGVATLVPPPFLEVAPEDADGGEVELQIDGVSLRLPARPVPGLPRGVVRLPRGLPGLEAAWGLPLPAWGTLAVRR